MEVDSNLRVIKLTDGDFLRTVENAVQFGQPVLLENIAWWVANIHNAHPRTHSHTSALPNRLTNRNCTLSGEELGPSLGPLLLKQVRNTRRVMYVVLLRIYSTLH